MVDDVPKSKENHEAGHNGPQKKRAIRPFLKVRPKHFFSRKFDMDVITDKSKDDLEINKKDAENGLSPFLDMRIFFLILFVGVPVLLYYLFAWAK